MILVVLNLLGVIQLPIVFINSLFITLLSIMTCINYTNNKKIQMFVGIFYYFYGIDFFIECNKDMTKK